jgi:hypothetical protein
MDKQLGELTDRELIDLLSACDDHACRQAAAVFEEVLSKPTEAMALVQLVKTHLVAVAGPCAKVPATYEDVLEDCRIVARSLLDSFAKRS